MVVLTIISYANSYLHLCGPLLNSFDGKEIVGEPNSCGAICTRMNCGILLISFQKFKSHQQNGFVFLSYWPRTRKYAMYWDTKFHMTCVLGNEEMKY